MKIKDMPYKHIDFEEVSKAFKAITEGVKNAKSAAEVLEYRKQYLELATDIYTQSSLSYIRYSCNTADEFYLKEKDYFDEIGPSLTVLETEYGNALLASPFRSELEKTLNPLLFKHLEVRAAASDPVIVEDMVEENKIVSEYSKLMADMEFEFRGEKMSRATLAGYFKHEDRQTRKEAYEVMGTELNKHAAVLDDIFDRLVKVRTRMARKLGHENFIKLGYNRMERVGYGIKEVEAFRGNVKEFIVPVVSALRTENAKELGIDKYMIYDDGITVKGGDPCPIGGKQEIFDAAKQMYHEMGEETGAFIDLMLENDAFDVDARKNKWGGGYCSELPLYKQPFILANFNGTADDVDVMTHEAGHALNSYLIADNAHALELACGGMETAETHSMSMEFFAWKYIDKFFGENAEKYKFMHAADALSFIPYGTIVDYFQHIVYENPDMTPAERNETWKQLEAQFRPYICSEGVPFVEDGRRWQYQMHIYESPFYYIDYCLAQTAAFGFLLASQEDYDNAFERYIHLVKQGGEKDFELLLTEAGLASPFKDGALKLLADKMSALISKIKNNI